MLVPVTLFMHTVARCTAPMLRPNVFNCARFTSRRNTSTHQKTNMCHLLIGPVLGQVVDIPVQDVGGGFQPNVGMEVRGLNGIHGAKVLEER